MKGYEIDVLCKQHGKIKIGDLAKGLGITEQRLRRIRNLDEVTKFEAYAIKGFFQELSKKNQ